MVLLRLVVFEQLCASARRKVGQLHFWVLSQHIGVELTCLLAPLLAGKAGKLLLVPFGDGEGESSLDPGLPTPGLACCLAGCHVWLLAAQVMPACAQPAGEGNAEIHVYCQQVATLGTHRETRAFGAYVCSVPWIRQCLG